MTGKKGEDQKRENKEKQVEQTADQIEVDPADSPEEESQKETNEQEILDGVLDREGNNWEQEKEELIDKIKRKQAEMDNLRRINKMEQAEAREYALYDFLCKLLPVLDNLERGLESARADEDIPQAHVEGLEMIYKQLYQVLEQEGVSAIEAAGAPFDPNWHHAVMEVESDEVEPGCVAEELQKGYRHRKRILRPALVKVCRE